MSGQASETFIWKWCCLIRAIYLLDKFYHMKFKGKSMTKSLNLELKAVVIIIIFFFWSFFFFYLTLPFIFFFYYSFYFFFFLFFSFSSFFEISDRFNIFKHLAFWALYSHLFHYIKAQRWFYVLKREIPIMEAISVHVCYFVNSSCFTIVYNKFKKKKKVGSQIHNLLTAPHHYTNTQCHHNLTPKAMCLS